MPAGVSYPGRPLDTGARSIGPLVLYTVICCSLNATMAMIGRPEAWLSASPAALDDGCAREALAKSSPDARMLPTTPANTLRFRAGMRGPLELPAGDITARFAEPLRSRLTVRICHMRWPSLRAS